MKFTFAIEDCTRAVKALGLHFLFPAQVYTHCRYVDFLRFPGGSAGLVNFICHSSPGLPVWHPVVLACLSSFFWELIFYILQMQTPRAPLSAPGGGLQAMGPTDDTGAFGRGKGQCSDRGEQ